MPSVSQNHDVCVQSRPMCALQRNPLVQTHGNLMGPGQCRTQEGSMVCRMEKIFFSTSSVEVSYRCLGKTHKQVPRSTMKLGGRPIICQTRQGKKKGWMFIIVAVTESAGCPPIFILPFFHSNRIPQVLAGHRHTQNKDYTSQPTTM